MTKRQNKGGRQNKDGRAVGDRAYSDDPLYRIFSSTLMEQDRLLWQKVAASVRPLPIKAPRINGTGQLERLPKSGNRFSDKRRGKNNNLEHGSDSKIATDALVHDMSVWVPPPLSQNCAPAAQPLPSQPSSSQAKAVAWQARNVPTSHILTTSSQKTFSPLSRKAQRRIARQYFDHTARLDLHGLRQDKAYELLLHFIHSNVQRNQSPLLVITGKGRSTGSSGILRQLVPQWLANPPFRLHVSAVEQALRHHGGEGAFYVRLRRMDDF